MVATVRRLTRTLTGYWRWRTGQHTHLYSLDRCCVPVCCIVCGRAEKPRGGDDRVKRSPGSD